MEQKKNVKQARHGVFGGNSAPEETAPFVQGGSYLAPGAVLEGTMHAEGDVEIAGEFRGDIITRGTAILRANMQGNLRVNRLELDDCILRGDVVADESVAVSWDSRIRGNVTAKELQCAGNISGDLKVSGHTGLEATAKVVGKVVTGTLSVSKGAVMQGSVETGVAGT